MGVVIPIQALIATIHDSISRNPAPPPVSRHKPVLNAWHNFGCAFPVSPSGHQSPDRLASIAAAEELKRLFPSREWRLICVDASYEDVLAHTGEVWRVMQARALIDCSFLYLCRSCCCREYWHTGGRSCCCGWLPSKPVHTRIRITIAKTREVGDRAKEAPLWPHSVSVASARVGFSASMGPLSQWVCKLKMARSSTWSLSYPP